MSFESAMYHLNNMTSCKWNAAMDDIDLHLYSALSGEPNKYTLPINVRKVTIKIHV